MVRFKLFFSDLMFEIAFSNTNFKTIAFLIQMINEDNLLV